MCTGYGEQKFEQFLQLPIIICLRVTGCKCCCISLKRRYNLSKATFRLPYVFSNYKKSRLCSIRNSKWININIFTRTTPHIHWEQSDYIINLILRRSIKVVRLLDIFWSPLYVLQHHWADHVLRLKSLACVFRSPGVIVNYLVCMLQGGHLKETIIHVDSLLFKTASFVQSSPRYLSSPTFHFQLCTEQHYLGINHCISVCCCFHMYV